MDKKIGIVDILLISIPSMAVIIEPIAAMVDTSFMGRIGTSELATIGLGVNVLLSISWMFNLLFIPSYSKRLLEARQLEIKTP